MSLSSGRFALSDGYWHMDDDAEIDKLAQNQVAVDESVKRVHEKLKKAASS
jgi:hypothetical protein